MDNLNDLKAIWLSAKTDDLPSSTEMLRIVKRFRDQKLRKKWMVIIMAIALAALMIAAILFNKPTLVTTYIGQVLAASACVVLAVSNIRSIGRFYKLNDCSNKEFIAFLEQTRLNQLYFYKNTQVWGMGLSSTGLLLYSYEFVYQNMLWCIITYSLVVVYILVFFFVVRPRGYKKEAKKLNATMEKLKELSNQIK